MSKFALSMYLLLCGSLGLSSITHAATVSSVTIAERGSGAAFIPWVIATDKSDGDAGTNRHRIRVNTVVNLDAGKFRIDLRLKESGGAVFQSASFEEDTSGGVQPFYSYTHDFEPTSVGQLNLNSDYLVEVEIKHWVANAFPPSFGSYQSYLVPVLSQSTAHQFLHFASNQASNLTENVLAEATSSLTMFAHSAAGYSLNCTLVSKFYRYDRLNEPLPAKDFFTAEVKFTLTQTDTGTAIPLQVATMPFSQFVGLEGYTHPDGQPKQPFSTSVAQAFTVQPTVGIDPTHHTYSLTAMLKFGPPGGSMAIANTLADEPSKIDVDLPPGSGWAPSNRACVLNPSLTFTLPNGATEWESTQTNVWIMEESKPIMFLASKVYWNAATNAMRFAGNQAAGVRQQWLNDLTLVKDDLSNPDKDVKRSNDHAFNGASAAVGDVTINSQGQLDGTVTLGNQGFRTHFPYDVTIIPQNGGKLDIASDSVTTASSHLDGVVVLSVPYSKLCASCADVADANPTPQVLLPSNSRLSFTSDGGLRGAGLTLNAVSLAWGRVPGVNADAHIIHEPFTSGVFLMAGHWLPSASGTDMMGPARLLLTGYKAAPNGALSAERPGTEAYGLGEGDYAGLNLRCAVDAAFTATSTLAGSSFDGYGLAGDSKYVTRFSGVTGRHNAIPISKVPAHLYGFEAAFSSFGMTFLDNANDHTASSPTSRIAGYIDIPYPSDFILPFEHITFTCAGNVKTIAPPASFHGATLAYWHLPFTAGDVSFPVANACSVPSSVPLQVQIKTFAQQIPEPLFATIGFWPDGQIVRPWDGDAANPQRRDTRGITSRFPLPATISLGGPGLDAKQEFYTLEPVADAYLNHEGIAPDHKPENGFFSVVGTIDLPFFQAVQVQAHLSSQAAATPFISLMGGWPNAGFRNGGDHFFTNPNFDKKHEGFPLTTTVSAYRNGDSVAYQPHVVGSWLDTLSFDHPIRWNKTARLFEARSDDEVEKVDIFLTDVDCTVPLVTPKRTEIKFGATFAGLPHISLANMAYNAVDDGRGLLAAFADESGLHDALTHAPDALSDLIAHDAERVLGPAIATTLTGTDGNASDGVLGTLAHQMATARDNSNLPIDDMVAFVSDQLNATVGNTGAVETSLLHVLGIGNGRPDLLTDVDARIALAMSAIDQLAGDNGIMSDSGRSVALLHRISQAVPLPEAVQVAIGDLNGLYEQNAAPTMLALQKVLRDTRERLAVIREDLSNGGPIAAELKAYASVHENALRASLNDASAAIAGEVQTALDNGGVQDRTEAEWQALMQRELTQAVLSNQAYITAVQDMLRNRLFSIESTLREGFDQWLATLNDTLRDVISRTLAQIDQKINSFLHFDLLKGGQFDGYAHINGDSLDELRVNAQLGLSVPDDMEFRGYLLIKDILASGGGGCFNGNVSSAYLIELGALDVPLKFGEFGVHADIAAKFAFISVNDGPSLPRSFGGSFEMRGKLAFQSFGISDLKAAMMFTLPFDDIGGENYISGFANVDLGDDGLTGGVFFGRACSVDPIKLWDPMVANLLGTDRVFEGIYVYGEGRIPVLDFGCPLNLSAGTGAGIFIFRNGPEVGGRLHMEIKGEALCTVTVKGEVDLAGRATVPLSVLERLRNGEVDVGATTDDLLHAANSLRASGRVTLKGKAGWCPCCVKVRKPITLTYKDRHFSADY